MALPKVVKAYLDEHIVPYDLVHHPRGFTAQETAAHTHTPGKAFAKTVIVEVDGQYLMAVLPAHRHLHLAKMKKQLQAKEIRLTEVSAHSTRLARTPKSTLSCTQAKYFS